MYKLSLLTAKLPTIQQARIVNSGFAIWVVWTGKLSHAVNQTLLDHGCMQLAEDSNQALWFSLSDECFRALARLQLWARLNTLTVFVQVFPVTFLVGFKFELSLAVPTELSNQEVPPPSQFEVWVHPKVKDKVLAIPGLELKPTSLLPGMASAAWELFQADAGISYPSALGWYFVIKPLGNPSDKAAIDGWRNIFREIQPVMEKLSLKYIYNEFFLIVSVDNLRVLRSWVKDILLMVKTMKEETKDYWPCVIAGVKKGSLNFNDELPRKITIAWNQLIPDFPHLSYSNAITLGKEYKINEIRFSVDQNTLEDWCYVSVSEMGGAAEEGELKLVEPKSLLAGEHPACFYCGMKNHLPGECPSRILVDWAPEVWDRIAWIGLEDMNKAFASMGESIAKGGSEALQGMLSGDTHERLLAQALFDLGSPVQHRMLRMVWRSKGKDMPYGLRQLVPAEGEFIWAALDSLRVGNVAQTEKLLGQAVTRFPRGYQPRSLQGFMALEAGDLVKAQFYWKEAERLSYTPLQQAWFLFLQGRLLECQDEFERATSLYKQAHNIAPRWHEAVYRQGVCMVKIGFTDQALSLFQDLICIEPHFFNKVLVDLELERGRIHILSGLGATWARTKAQVEEKVPRLDKLSLDFGMWFMEGDEFLKESQNRVENLLRLKAVKNFVAFERLLEGLQSLSQDMGRRIEGEIKTVNDKVERAYKELREVYREAAWFPFPKLLRDFNRDFNACAERLKFIRNHPLQIAENFKKSQRFLGEVEDKIKTLRGRLVTLKIIRDSTFFTLLLGKNFIWLELAGLGLSLVFLPLIIWLTQKYGSGMWWADLVVRQKWQIQKGLIIIMSIAAMALAALKTAIAFEKKKEQLFAKESGDA